MVTMKLQLELTTDERANLKVALYRQREELERWIASSSKGNEERNLKAQLADIKSLEQKILLAERKAIDARLRGE